MKGRLHCLTALLGAMLFAPALFSSPLGAPFAAPPSGAGSRGLTRLSPEESGLAAVSAYQDPRAWGERLQPASIGTVGTGIGSGDFNGDGLPDLFVAMREGRNRLYLNRDGQAFVDGSQEAGILESPDWATGVTVVDINGDTFPDIYVCFYDAPNRLYLNRGDASFEEVAEEWGVAVSDASSGAFFADYDRDGDLDLYLQTNVKHGLDGGGRPDYFFRNEGGAGFSDATEKVGILLGKEGATLGHSVLWVDFDSDGWEDLYVANDFRAPDFLYLNNGNGTFRYAPRMVPVAPYSSMGSDAGDVDNDGQLDLLTTDMATPSYLKHVESMLTSAVKTRDLELDSLPAQTMKNALLLNRGRGDYVDVGYAWNVAATDWTWAPRLVDLDNDGWVDAFFTNGMIRQFHNADLALEQDRQASVQAKTAVFKRSPVLEEENLVFRNAEGSGFERANERWGFEHEGVSFGAALLDFDQDGDLDIAYTNYEAPPTLWRNDLGDGDAVQVRLLGSDRNTHAIGATAVAYFGRNKLAQKILSNRGYLGSDEKILHFGLGNEKRIDLLEIHWPDGTRQEARDLRSGHRYVIKQEKGDRPDSDDPGALPPARFEFQGEDPGKRPKPASQAYPERRGALYPFKPMPAEAWPRMIRADFDGNEQADVLIVRDWAAPRLILSGKGGMREASQEWGLEGHSGVWEVAFAEDFDRDGLPDVFLGGMGLNNEVSYRGEGEGKMIRYVGRFSPDGPLVNLNGYVWGDQVRLYDGYRDYVELEESVRSVVSSFRETGELTASKFIERTGFVVEDTYEISRFRSGLLLNESGSGFRFEPLPLEAQYGRVWDAASGELNGDGLKDLVLLLGQVSPHSRASQEEGTFEIGRAHV